MALRALFLFVLLAAVETAHGVLRVRLLNRRLGDRRARQVGVLTGSGLILLVAGATAPWLGVRTAGEAAAVGAVWMVLMLVFEVAVGRLAFGVPWSRLAADFDPRRGGWLGFGFLVLGAAPWLAARWHDLL